MIITDSVSKQLSVVQDPATRQALQGILADLADRFSSFMQTTAGLVIKAGASPLVKTGGAISYLFAGGIPRTIAAGVDMAALAGTTLTATFNVYVYMVNGSGALSSAMGTGAATYAAVKFPTVPDGRTVVGYTIINPTGTGSFVGGTTAIDDATVVPNAVHISVAGLFDPTIRP